MNKALENYECDGQINIFDWLKDKPHKPTKEELDAKYDIPRTYQKKEGWTDDWHYTELENPPETNIYYCITLLKGGHYNYTYMAWAYGHWWAYAGYGTKWLFAETERRKEWMKPFAWVRVPDLYYRTDPQHQFLCEHFVTEEDWKYEQSIMKMKKEGL